MKQHLLAVILVGVCFSSCKNNLDSIRETFGTKQNPARLEHQLVPVEPGFQLTEDISVEGRRFIFVNEEENKLAVPGYLRKIILLDTTKQYISIEEDHFKNPAEKKYLVVQHLYPANLFTISLQDILENPSPGSSIAINKYQADSVLRSWNIAHNPFATQIPLHNAN